MFQINDVVVYGTEGVCKITDIEDKVVTGTKIRYFVLQPQDSRNSTVFVPFTSEKLLSKMRKTSSKKEIDALIDSMQDIVPKWIANENERKLTYKKILVNGDSTSLITMLKALYLHKKSQESKGKHLHASDERFFKAAEQLLYGEWQYVLNMEREALVSYISGRIENSSTNNIYFSN